MIYNLEFYFQSNNKCECWTRHFQTCQFSKQWIPYGSLCRFLEEMLQQNEEVKKRERERATGALEKREGDTEKKEKNYHEKVKKKTVQKAKGARNPDWKKRHKQSWRYVCRVKTLIMIIIIGIDL